MRDLESFVQRSIFFTLVCSTHKLNSFVSLKNGSSNIFIKAFITLLNIVRGHTISFHRLLSKIKTQKLRAVLSGSQRTCISRYIRQLTSENRLNSN